MQDEQEITQQESLAIIQSMINKAKSRFSENGHLYLFWGWLVLICNVSQFVLLHFMHSSRHYMVWFVCWAAVIYQMFYFSKKRRLKTVRTYTDEIIKYVWIVFLVNIILVTIVFGQVLGEKYYLMMGPVMFVIYAVPTFLSGVILRFKPLIIGGCSCWLIAIAALFIEGDYQLLLVSVAMIFAWIIPGYLLRERFKKSNT